MFTNYFKIALRHLWRNKIYSFINVFGLAIGLTCSFLVMLLIQDELSYDRFHAKSNKLYRIEQDQFYDGEPYHVNVTPWPCVPSWKADIPEVLDATRAGNCGGRSFRWEDQAFIENNVMAVDPAFFTMFDFELQRGDPNSVLNDPFAVVIDESTASKYFGDNDPLGEVLTVDKQFKLTVTGVVKKAPRNSSIRPVIMVSIEFAKQLGEYNEGWGNNSIRSYALLHENADVAEVNRKLTEVVNNHRENESKTKYMAAPLTGIRLHGYFGFNDRGEALQRIYMFSVIAAFVLLIASINFMNLSTARSANRAREIGIRKVVGAYRRNLILQFLGESMLLTLFSVILSIGFVYMVLPVFNSISGKMLSISLLLQKDSILLLIAITLITGLFAGSYPAIFLSSFKPIKVLKGNLSHGTSQYMRKGLVIVQFTLSILLIIATIIVQQQLNFSRSKDLGFDKENVIAINISGEKRNSYEALRRGLANSAHVVSVTASSHRPTNIGSNSGGIEWDGKDPDQSLIVSMSAVDFDYVETLGIDMVEGRSFSRKFGSDPANDDGGGSFMINEALVKIIGKDQIINESLSFIGIEGPIVGIMGNFHFKSMRQEIEPLAVAIIPPYFNNVLIRLAPGDATESLVSVEKIWDEVYAGIPFEYQFLDEDLDRMYRVDRSIGRLIKYLAIIAIIIAYLGLFGLASFTAEQRSKEIGIRKVLGASMPHLVYLLTIQFAKWVAISCLIAFPLAYYALSSYLQNFAYRIDIGYMPFVIAGSLAFTIALLTVSFQAARAALANPVDSLKYE